MKTKLISATLGALLLTGSTLAMADRDDNRRGEFRGRDRGADMRGHDLRGHDVRKARDFDNFKDVRRGRGHHKHKHFRHHVRPRWHGDWAPQWHHGYRSHYRDGHRSHYRHDYAPRYRNRDGGLTIILRSTIR